MLIGLNVISCSCISKLIGWKLTSFGFTSAENMSLLPGSAAKSDENIIVEGESMKVAEKDPRAAVVASIHLTGATVVGGVNVTEFWQRRT